MTTKNHVVIVTSILGSDMQSCTLGSRDGVAEILG